VSSLAYSSYIQVSNALRYQKPIQKGTKTAKVKKKTIQKYKKFHKNIYKRVYDFLPHTHKSQNVIIGSPVATTNNKNTHNTKQNKTYKNY